MMQRFVVLAFLLPVIAAAGEQHDHPAPEKLGSVSFPTSCQPRIQHGFDRAVALLHSFAYKAAEDAFRSVAEQDPQCAMAHWGIAMTHFHQLWEPPIPVTGITAAQNEIKQAERLNAPTERERGFIHALSLLFDDPASPYRTRASNYELAMQSFATANPADVEAQVFYALALLANASPTDKTHFKQKQAAALLEPLYRRFPNHPGIPHYLIHASDSQEMASQGLAAARAYSKIAPSAPHALHMPSHIFTRLGMWDDSIASNLAARAAAQQQHDTGEELHAMDYLVYAYLQTGRDRQAAEVMQQLGAMQNVDMSDFKSGYAVTVIPIRCIVERQQWSDAEKISPPASALPQVLAIAVWARGLGLARDGDFRAARAQAEMLSTIEESLRASRNDYWATQVNIMTREVIAWSAQSEGRPEEASTLLRSAADDEDGIEKLPATPGPIIPAREQLGELLLEQRNFAAAAQAFETALVNAPGRRGALKGAAYAAAHASATK